MRYRSLDSVRGLAAFVVLLYHALLVFPGTQENRRAFLVEGWSAPMAWLYATPLRIFVSGPAAVLLFFVLSGFVLTLNLASPRRPTYGEFALSRYIRIWIPFAVVIFASAVLSKIIPQQPILSSSDWFRYTWSIGATTSNIISHLLMTGTAGDLDNPMWSLVHELRVSLIFPVLFLVASKRPLISLASSIVLMIICVAFLKYTDSRTTFIMSLAQTGTYIYFFIAGIVLAKNFDFVLNKIQHLPVILKPSMIFLSLLCLSFSPSTTNNISTFGSIPLLLMNGIAAASIIAFCALPGKLSRFLTKAAPSYLGRISYSLYLTHLITITSVVYALGPDTPLVLAVVLALPLSVAIADLCQRFIEMPSHRLAKVITARAPTSPAEADTPTLRS